MQLSKTFELSSDAQVGNGDRAWVTEINRTSDRAFVDVTYTVPRHCYASLSAALDDEGLHCVYFDHASRWFEAELIPLAPTLDTSAGLEALIKRCRERRVRVVRMAPPDCGHMPGMRALSNALVSALREYATAKQGSFAVTDPLVGLRPRGHLAAVSADLKAHMVFACLQANPEIARKAEQHLTELVAARVVRRGVVWG